MRPSRTSCRAASHCGWWRTMKASMILSLGWAAATPASCSASATDQADRLLAEDVLVRLERADRPGHVQMVGQRIVNGVDVAVGEQFLVRAVGLFDAELGGDRLGPRQVARGNGRDGAELAAIGGRE